MANVQLTSVEAGTLVTVDALLVDPTTAIASMSAQQLREAGVSQGTRITPSSGQPFDVQETVQLAKTIVASGRPPSLSSIVLRDGMPGATQVFNAAGPAVITGLRVTVPANGAGTYLISVAGTAQTSDAANAGATMQLFKNGVAIGTQLRWGVAQFIGNNSPAMGLGAMGWQLQDTAIVGDFYEVFIGVLPGGVGGDDITVTDVTITAVKVS